ncbi:hypothetical protein Ddye_029121 [Dipteronia dyeriana]|uniref:Reverse transcriptase domain-containing protein n=1 Tax=Dipteronia dyeriana TaxID=168575 RepID=A0AAD9TDV2_9ROSI|nr:hypothetical protein Ddye_029121 [Dipteronia dyeriana]
MVVEVLSRMLFKAKELGMIKGIGFQNDVIHLTHLQFADDMVLFIDPCPEYLLNAKRILRCFELASGLKINFHKSCLIPAGVAKKIEKLQRDFFWKYGILKKKVHAVDCISICRSKKEGGLGIERIKDKGVSLLAKWI